MSMHIKQDILEVIENSPIELLELESEECALIRKKIVQLYCKPNNSGDVLWEDFKEYRYISDSDGWRLIKKFINRKCVLFFNKSDDKSMLLVNSGEDLEYILSETYGFEFYVTDLECSYLFCFNHHDILYGCGLASKWI